MANKMINDVSTPKRSTHEVTLCLNKAVLLLKQKKVEEAKKEIENAIKLSPDPTNIRDERFIVLQAFILLEYSIKR